LALVFSKEKVVNVGRHYDQKSNFLLRMPQSI